MSLQLANYTGGDYLYQGMSSMGKSIAGGIQDYQKMRQQDQIASGQLDRYLQSGMVNPDSFQGDTKKAYERVVSGKASVSDKMALLGAYQTEGAIQSQKMQQAMEEMKFQQAQKAMADAQRREQTLSQIGSFASGGGTAGTGPMNNARYQEIAGYAQDPVISQAAKYHKAGLDVDSTSIYQGQRADQRAQASDTAKVEVAKIKGQTTAPKLPEWEQDKQYLAEAMRLKGSKDPQEAQIGQAMYDKYTRPSDIQQMMRGFAGAGGAGGAPTPTPTPTPTKTPTPAQAPNTPTNPIAQKADAPEGEIGMTKDGLKVQKQPDGKWKVIGKAQ